MLRLAVLSLVVCCIIAQNAGYKVRSVTGFKKISEFRTSSLFDSQVDDMSDKKPIKILEIVADSHYEAGYHYGAIMGPIIVECYNIFLGSAFHNEWERRLVGEFLDWQYDSYVSKELPVMFLAQLHGIQEASWAEHKIFSARAYLQRVLTISSYPGDFGTDILYTLVDQMLRDRAYLKNEKLLNLVETGLFKAVKFLEHFLNKRLIKCSFFGLWGSRTEGGQLFTMRNLDWQANTGINKYKLITVWKIKGTIPHATLGFPGVIGALTGISAAGLTVHEAGLDSMRATELGFQWSLRLRYILMKAKDLTAAKEIWKSTNNTLGMNHMVASAGDLATGEPVMVVETMRNYTAWFLDKDKREDATSFTDPKTKEVFRAGFAMKDAVFRTNHAYDPFINEYRTSLPTKSSSTMQRYFVLKDSILFYEGKKPIGVTEALNITANVAHKGGNDHYRCPQVDDGTNVISVLYIPGELRMLAGFQFGEGQNYHTACCGVYVDFDLKPWFQESK